MNTIDYLMFWMLMFEHMEPGHTLTRSQRIYWASNSLKYLIRSHHMDCLEENRGRTILKFLKISDYYKGGMCAKGHQFGGSNWPQPIKNPHKKGYPWILFKIYGSCYQYICHVGPHC